LIHKALSDVLGLIHIDPLLKTLPRKGCMPNLSTKS
jgi:hypothetical protein